MRTLPHLHHHSFLERNKKFGIVYLGGALLALHYYLIIYVHSTLLGQFFSDGLISLFFALGSLLSLLSLLCAPSLLHTFKENTLLTLALTIEGFALLGLAYTSTPLPLALSFLAHQSIIGFLLYLFDMFLEKRVRHEGRTGEVRGVFLTLSNIMLVVSPLIVGSTIDSSGTRGVYVLSFIALLFMFFLHPEGEKKLPLTREEKPLPRTVKKGMYAHLLLHIFYAWMVVWSPVYLSQVIGLTWSEIGLAFSIMLLPFALFELPLGELADTRYGEKEIMMMGFFVMGISTICLFFIESANPLVWALALFITRSGAASVEIATESYFFKHVSAEERHAISYFRSLRPLAFLIGPALGASMIHLLSFPLSFVVLGALMCGGIIVASTIIDTR